MFSFVCVHDWYMYVRKIYVMHVCLCLNALYALMCVEIRKQLWQVKILPYAMLGRISCLLPYMPGYPGHMLLWSLLFLHAPIVKDTG